METKGSKSNIFSRIKVILVSAFIGASLGISVSILPPDILSRITGFWHNSVYNAASGMVVFDIAAGAVVLIWAYYLQVIIHECGHLVFGLISGYKFVSIRVSRFTLIRDNGKFRMKRFFVEGTGGQCLMDPPGMEEGTPYILYNLGGVLFNFLSVLICIAVFGLFDSLFPLSFFLLTMILFGISAMFFNGVPMRIGGIANDAYNIQLLKNDEIARKAFFLQLRVNSLLSGGIRMKDMPEEWFILPADADPGNYLHASVRIMEGSRYMDKLDFDGAYTCFDSIRPYFPELIEFYRREVSCELIFLKILKGQTKTEIRRMFTPDMQDYVKRYEKYMLNKKRLLYAYALLIERDEEKASGIYGDVQRMLPLYPLKGDADSELAIMNYVKDFLQDKNEKDR